MPMLRTGAGGNSGGGPPAPGSFTVTPTETVASDIDFVYLATAGWTQVANPDSFRGEVSADGVTDWETAFTALGSDRTADFGAPINDGSEKYYRVIAVKNGVDSLPSAVAHLAAAQTVLTASIASGTTIDVTSGADEPCVWQTTTDGSTFVIAALTTANGTITVANASLITGVEVSGTVGGDRTWFSLPLSPVPAPIDPATLSPTLFMDARSVTVRPTGDAVPYTDWLDQSGNGNNPTKGAGTYRGNAANGQPLVRLNSSSPWFTFPLNNNTLPVTQIVVYRRTATVSGTLVRGVLTNDQPGAGGYSLGLNALGAMNFEMRGGAAFADFGYLPSNNEMVVQSGVYTGSPSATTRLRGWVNQGVPWTDFSYTAPGSWASPSTMELGVYDDSSGFAAPLDVFMGLVFPGDISASLPGVLEWIRQLIDFTPQNIVADQAYLYPAFTADGAGGEVLHLQQSADGITFTGVPNVYPLPVGYSVRDASLLGKDGYLYVAHTSKGFSNNDSFIVGRASYTRVDGAYQFAAYKTVSCASVANIQDPWGPKWFVDANGDPHIVICISDTITSKFKMYELHPLTSDLSGSWSNPAEITGTSLPANLIDALIFTKPSDPGAWWIIVKDEDTKYLILLRSTTGPFSGYTVNQSGDWAGWGNQREGPSVVYLGGTSWRVYMDYYADLTGIHHSESTDDMATFTAPAVIVSPTKTRNGVIIPNPIIA